MRNAFRGLFVLAGSLTLCVVAPNFVAAQSAPDYPGPDAPGVPTEVAGVVIARNPSAAPAPEVAGTQASRGASRGTTGAAAPTGQALPVTGGDIAGLVVLGFGAIGTGGVLLRRSRARSA